ncbi:GL23598 [Drosophila persimilis]|uniref:Protein hedgehog n=1 Tax=Drosophila persimilis TaxID=7234 RepID=HH_DROPE|nr:protein hedgehog [Drosophila persimilis]B4G2I8.1 RecName: Full=Protein hedgehog; Contains: RecName: Full=Protein hedgehog N-product; Flags: Precursor [Drosophila persimilis]EDW24033.1 GL23598 [Drosophila persimilis]
MDNHNEVPMSMSAPWASAARVTCLSLDAKCHRPCPSSISASASASGCASDSAAIATTKLRHIAYTQRCSSRLTMLMTVLLLLLPLSFTPAHSCGPGRGLGRRRERNLYPLVLKQTIPNLSEYQSGASGPLEGEIKRDSPKFKDLVPNYNRDILFRDEEGTGADRLMTKRCKEKLNVLAYSVMNEWPGVRLLVTESWDEDHQHGQESLHYEGRAVTIATSDREPSRYGMLARLAVEAGFDWVSYVSRRHIYCSVKSDSSISSHVHGCFTPESTALLESGITKPLSEIAIGDRVLSMGSNGQPVYSEVILFMDRNLEQMQNFVELHTDGGAVLTVTPAHLISVWHPERQQLDYVFADRVEELNYVLVRDPQTGELRPQRVVRVGSVRSKGVVAPLTREGTIVVNSVAASCYAVIDSQSLAHWGLAPMRILAMLQSWMPAKDQLRSSQTEGVVSRAEQQNGIHWYANALYKVKDYVLPKSWRHD